MRLLLHLWSSLALVLVVLAGHASAAGPSGSAPSTAIDLASDLVVESDRGLWVEHELDAVEIEVDDDDARSDAPATTTPPLALASAEAHGGPVQALADTGRPLVSTGLARGPPVVG